MRKILLYLIMIISITCISVDAYEMNPKDVGARTYVVGEHMFTRKPVNISPYSGVLTADYLMLASQTIYSQDIKDMVIYYKNPRGIWMNAVTNEILNDSDIPEIFNITYKDALLYAPELKICQYENNNYYCYESLDNDTYNNLYSSYDDGKLTYYLVSELDDDAEMEIYEKIGDTYNKLEPNSDGYVEVNIEIGKTKTFVSRYYVHDENSDTIYSDYSNEIVIGSERILESLYATPVLERVQGFTFDGETFAFDLINNAEGKCRSIGDSNTVCDMEYAELYEVDDDNTIKILDNFSIFNQNEIKQLPKTVKKYFIKGYLIDKEGNRIYTENSNYLTVDLSNIDIKEKPILTVNSNVTNSDGTTTYKVEIQNKNAYGENYKYRLLYKNNDGTYRSFYSSEASYDPDGTIHHNGTNILDLTDVNVSSSEMLVLVAQVFYPVNTEEVFTEMSDEINIINSPKLVGNMYDDNYYIYTFEINDNFYCAGNCQNNNYTIDGYEIYEKTNDGYELQRMSSDIDDLSNLKSEFSPYDNAYFIIEPNTNKTFVAKVYIKDENNKYYSGYSNEIIINKSIDAPELVISKSNTQEEHISYNDGVYQYNLKINANDYLYDNEKALYMIDGFDIYEKESNSLVVSSDVNDIAVINISEGLSKTYYAKAFVNINDKKYYSDGSNEINIVTVKVPSLSTNGHLDFSNKTYKTSLKIDYQNIPNITKFEIQKKLDNATSTYSNGASYDPESVVLAESTPGYRYLYRARAKYIDENGVEHYSAYSNEVGVGYSNYEVPVISLLKDPYIEDDKYKVEIKLNNIMDYYVYNSDSEDNLDNYTKIVDGIKIYEKNETGYTEIIDSNNLNEIKFELPSSSIGSKTYVAKIYVINTTGNNVAPDLYSNEVSFTLPIASN